MSAPLIAIVGATASGKSAAALEFAARAGAEIVTCDSRQIYRGLDVGTAKPSRDEQARVPHHLLDLVDPDERYSAARWAAAAATTIAAIRARNKLPLLVGGTGLYLRALRFGLADAMPSDTALRDELSRLESAEPGALHRRLATIDPASATRLPPRDLVRIIRAIEVHALTGKTLTQHFLDQSREERTPMRVALLDPPMPELDARIAARSSAIIRGGLVEETRAIRDRFGAGAPGLASIGYVEALQYLAGELPDSQLTLRIIQATRQYARRQRNWFRSEPGATRFSDGAALVDWLDRAATKKE